MRFRLPLVCCVLSLIASCAGPGTGLVHIEHPEQPLERHGVVCYPPAEGSWSLGEQARETESLLYFRQDNGAPDPIGKVGPSTIVTLLIASIPAAEFSKRYPSQHAALEAFALAAAKPSSDRLKCLSSETSRGVLLGAEFVRLCRRLEERDNPGEPTAVLQIEERTTWLFHPNQPATVIQVEVSHRRPAGGESPSLLGLEQGFLEKLSFR